MTYSIIGILATVILLISNRDILFKKNSTSPSKTLLSYRAFLIGVTVYYVTDMLWGILNSHGLILLLYIDTVIHFLAMVTAVMLWSRYVVMYLGGHSLFVSVFKISGIAFVAFEVIVLAVNLFYPVQFYFDEEGVYHVGFCRYITLAIQIALFVMTSFYTLCIMLKTEGAVRRRHLTVGLFGLVMVLFIMVQLFYPLLPFYSMGYMIGICLLHSFVVEDEKDEYRRELEENGRALSDALELAQSASRAKTAFLSNMSHEIRTPMNAIIGLNNIAMQEEGLSDEVRGYLSKVDMSAKHLLSIINDILDMSRIESGRMVIKQERFRLSDLLDQVNTMIEAQCRNKGLEYKFELDGKLDGYYLGDFIKLKQILINVLSNAVKFTPEGGHVSFVTSAKPSFDSREVLKFVVTDDGIGMSEEFLPHLFDVFTQEDSSYRSEYGTTGLGMPITKNIVELMDGNISVQSRKGEGSVFTITVMLTKDDGTPAPGNNAKSEAQDLHERPPVSLEGKRILLAEDVDVNAEIIIMYLSAKNVETELAKNGMLAVQMYEEHEAGYYDAVLMDMRMPEMDGLEAARRIRSSAKSDAGAIPIIALTANAFDEDVNQSIQAGMNAHLSKPIEPEILYGTLEELLDKKSIM